MAGLHKPCICRVQGPVYAGGFLLVGGSTYVVAAESATFTLPEVKRGLFPFQVLDVLLDIMPYRTALDLCLRAKTLTATDALKIGLITDVVPADGLDAAIVALTDELKQYSPTAMQFGLRAAQQIKNLPSGEHQGFFTRTVWADSANTRCQRGDGRFSGKTTTEVGVIHYSHFRRVSIIVWIFQLLPILTNVKELTPQCRCCPL